MSCVSPTAGCDARCFLRRPGCGIRGQPDLYHLLSSRSSGSSDDPAPSVLLWRSSMRNRFHSLTLAGLLFVPMLSSAHAQVLDQSNAGAVAGSFFGYFWQGQTFRPSANTSVGGGFRIYSERALTGLLMVELWSDVASNGGAT